MKLSIISLSLGLSILMLPLSVFAATVTVADDTTLTFPDGTTFTLNSGSQFESLTINTSSVDFVFNTDSVVNLTSSNRLQFAVTGITNNTGHSYVCNPDNSTANIKPDAGMANGTTVTVTAPSTCASASTSSGGGGGGNGPVVFSGTMLPPLAQVTPTPTPTTSTNSTVQQLQAQLAALTAQIAALTGKTIQALPPQASPVAQFVRNLAIGSSGSDVLKLQAFLASDKSIYPEGKITGYFGKLTSEAVKRFQKKYGISQLGNVGPKTRAKLNQLLSQ